MAWNHGRGYSGDHRGYSGGYGRGGGGGHRDWPNDHRGHVRAGKKGWRNRSRDMQSGYSRGGGSSSRGGRGGRGGRDWTGDSAGHARVAREAWRNANAAGPNWRPKSHQRQFSRAARAAKKKNPRLKEYTREREGRKYTRSFGGRDYRNDGRDYRERDWRGEPERHATAAHKGWRNVASAGRGWAPKKFLRGPSAKERAAIKTTTFRGPRKKKSRDASYDSSRDRFNSGAGRAGRGGYSSGGHGGYSRGYSRGNGSMSMSRRDGGYGGERDSDEMRDMRSGRRGRRRFSGSGGGGGYRRRRSFRRSY